MNTYRIKLTRGPKTFNGHGFQAENAEEAWDKAMKEWGECAKLQQNSSVGPSSFCGGEFEAELVEIHRCEWVKI